MRFKPSLTLPCGFLKKHSIRVRVRGQGFCWGRRVGFLEVCYIMYFGPVLATKTKHNMICYIPFLILQFAFLFIAISFMCKRPMNRCKNLSSKHDTVEIHFMKQYRISRKKQKSEEIMQRINVSIWKIPHKQFLKCITMPPFKWSTVATVLIYYLGTSSQEEKKSQ